MFARPPHLTNWNPLCPLALPSPRGLLSFCFIPGRMPRAPPRGASPSPAAHVCVGPVCSSFAISSGATAPGSGWRGRCSPAGAARPHTAVIILFELTAANTTNPSSLILCSSFPICLSFITLIAFPASMVCDRARLPKNPRHPTLLTRRLSEVSTNPQLPRRVKIRPKHKTTARNQRR